MARIAKVLVAVTSVLTVLSPAIAAGLSHTAASDQAYVESQLYEVSLFSFAAAAAHGDPWFDWSTDYCSAPLIGSTGRSFNFTKPCRRHDFGYRNLQLIESRYGLDAWNEGTRKRVDRQFLADMRAHCSARPWYDRPTCFTWADTFYAAVRIGG